MRFALLPLFAIMALAGAALAGNTGDTSDNSDNGPASCSFPKPSCQVGNPINLKSGNKYHNEPIYRGAGEMPLSFELHYNSRHYQTALRAGGAGVCIDCKPTVGQPTQFNFGTIITDLVGQWTSSYQSFLLIDPSTVGNFNSIIELRRDTGQSIYFRKTALPDHYVTVADGLYGYFKAIDDGPARYEFESVEGMTEVFNANGQLIEVRSKQGATHSLAYSDTALGGGVTETTVTVTRTLGGQMSFIYQTDASSNPDDYCYRCPSEFIDPDGVSFLFGSNALGLIDTVSFPKQGGGFDTKTFLYEIGENTYPQGCNAFWTCETALTGIIDEESHRFATWLYRNQRDIPSGNAPMAGWAYTSFHGEGAEIDDHVLARGFGSNPEYTFYVRKQGDPGVNPFIPGSGAGGFAEVYMLSHWDFNNEALGYDGHTPVRLSRVVDIRTHVGGENETQPENVEEVRRFYDYYSLAFPFASGLVSRDLTIGPVGSSAHRWKEYEYDAGGNQLLVIRREGGWPNFGSLQRVTEFGWDLARRLPTMTRVSANGTLATAEYQVDTVYEANGRIQSRTRTDLTTHTSPYPTNGRQRAVHILLHIPRS